MLLGQKKIFMLKGERKIIPKGTILLHAGDVCKYTYRVLKGCLKSYVIDGRGKEHIIQFAPEEWIISDMDSFLNENPSQLFIEALEDCELTISSKSDLYAVDEFDKEQLLQIIHKLQKNLISTNNRLIGLLKSSSQERYRDFTQKYPTLVQRLPQKLIASYIGITPEYLSEIRRKMMTK